MTECDEKRLRTFEMKIYRRLLGITWREKTNEFVKNKIRNICGFEPEGVVEMVKKRKFQYFGHIIRGGGTAKAVMEGVMEGRRGRGRPQTNWMKNLNEWSGMRPMELSKMTVNRNGWRKAVKDWVHPQLNQLRR